MDGPAFAPHLADGFGRRFEYLRLSLTEACNFRCAYCLPDGFRRDRAAPPELSLEEIVRAVRGFAALGLWKVRLTGGEPTLRRDFAHLAGAVAAVPGVRRLAMTTNGYRLAAHAAEWRAAGVTDINVSIDSLDPARFAQVTGHDRLGEVLAGVEAATGAGFRSVKINAVLMRGINDDAFAAVADFVRTRPVTWRFIEAMRTNDTTGFFAERHLGGAAIRRQLVAAGWTPLARDEGAGPSVDYAHPGSVGRIGLIAPYASGFCETCNRLRLSSRGKLHLCLFGEAGVALRDLLQSDADHDALVARIRTATGTKTAGHRLHEGDSGATPHLASIGG